MTFFKENKKFIFLDNLYNQKKKYIFFKKS
jgi:hypothetical protein